MDLEIHKQISTTKNETYLGSTLYRSSEINQLKAQSDCNSTDNMELNHEEESDLKRIDNNDKQKFLSINDIQSQPKDTVESDIDNHNNIPIRQSVELHQD